MKTRTKVRLLTVILLLISILGTAVMYKTVEYLDKNLILLSQKQIEAADTSDDVDDLRWLARSAQSLLLESKKSLTIMTTDLAYVFIVLSLVSVCILFVSRKIRD
jgi:hypothetical protein